MSQIIRCDHCQKEAEMLQPNVKWVEPEGWWYTKAVGKTTTYIPRRAAPHACSIECAKEVFISSGLEMDTYDSSKPRVFVNKDGTVRELVGAARCKNCARIMPGKMCMYHGMKPLDAPMPLRSVKSSSKRQRVEDDGGETDAEFEARIKRERAVVIAELEAAAAERKKTGS